MDQRCVRHPFPYAGTIQFRFEGSQSQARCRATPNGSYILNVSTVYPFEIQVRHALYDES